MVASGKSLAGWDTTVILITFAFMAAAQVAKTILQRQVNGQRMAMAVTVCLVGGLLYGSSVYIIEWLLQPSVLNMPQPLNAIYITALSLVVLCWVMMNVHGPFGLMNKSLGKRGYVYALNASQPHPKTMTAVRRDYQY
jgi:NAD(P)H-quinone oxidoreductase subunit 5